MRVLYRADGGRPIGTGHLFRAVRLLKEWDRRGGVEVELMTAVDSAARGIAEDAPARLTLLPFHYAPDAVKPLFLAEPVVKRLSEEPFDLVAVDMLDTLEKEMEAVAAAGVPLVTFDDRGPGRKRADTLINILVEEPEPASLSPQTRLLEGGPYVVLDPIYAEAHRNPVQRAFGPLRRIFVAMGGADAIGLSVKVARALRMVEGLEEVEFLCGPAFPHRAELEEAIHGASWRARLLSGLPSLLECYYRCDLAIVAGGLTMYEVCCVGAPALAVCQPIDHQQELSARLARAGAMETVGYGTEVRVERIAEVVRRLAEDVGARRRMAACGPQLVDGWGTQRVVDALIDTARHRGVRQEG
jgi:spore coat polysaccharide biosynthesis predicted glycosyltransferase SpsG